MHADTWKGGACLGELLLHVCVLPAPSLRSICLHKLIVHVLLGILLHSKPGEGGGFSRVSGAACCAAAAAAAAGCTSLACR